MGHGRPAGLHAPGLCDGPEAHGERRVPRRGLLRAAAGGNPGDPPVRAALLSKDHRHLFHGDGLRPGRADHAGVLRQSAEQDALRRARPHRRRIDRAAGGSYEGTHGVDDLGQSPRQKNPQKRCGGGQELPGGSGVGRPGPHRERLPRSGGEPRQTSRAHDDGGLGETAGHLPLGG